MIVAVDADLHGRAALFENALFVRENFFLRRQDLLGFGPKCVRQIVEFLLQKSEGAPRGSAHVWKNRTLREGIESNKTSRAKQQQEATEFRRALDAGETPPLRPFVFTTDYSPGDFAALLQSGGIQLLDLETLTALRNDETIIRWGLSRMTRYTKLSDELIVPNLDQDISFFYDPATKKLRKRF